MTLPEGGTSRSKELARLERLTERTCSGRGGFAVVVGDAGMGKSHLLRAAAATASERMNVAWGTTASWAGAEPFGIWAQVLSTLAPRPVAHSDPGAPPPPDPSGDLWRSVGARLVRTAEPAAGMAGGTGLARLALFDDVRALLSDAAAARPTLVILDDLHLVHPSALDLLSSMVPSLGSMPLAVVAATRADRPNDGASRRDRLRALERQAEVIALPALASGAIAGLVASEGGPEPGTELSSAIAERSGGNPLFALELVRLIAGRDPVDLTTALENWGIPETVMAVSAERVRSLSPGARSALEVAAVLGTEFRRSDVDALVDHVDPSVDLEAALAELARGSLVEPMGHDVRFTHGVVRDAVLHGEIPPRRRRRLHGAVVEVAGTSGNHGPALSPADLAAHLLASDLPDRVDRAADELVAAARRAIGSNAHVEALTYAEEGLALVGDSGPRGAELLLGKGTALLAVGEVQPARATFERAAQRSREAGQPVLLARAALGVGSGETGFEIPLLDEDQIALLRDALDRLPPSPSIWRARLLARLSVALTSTDDAVRVELSDDAVRIARALDDPSTLAASLAAHCDALAGPDHTVSREEWSTDIIDLARRCSDPGLKMLGLRLRLVARLERGDVVGALRDAEDFSAAADRLGQPTFRWYPHLWRAMRLLLAGQSAGAFDAAGEAEAEGRRADSANAEMLVLSHRWMHWVQTGDTDSLRSLIESFDDGDALPTATWARVSLAYAFAHVGRLNASRLQLDAVDEELRSAPRDSEWVPMLAQLADAVSLCGGHEVARWAYDALVPYRGQHIVDGIGAAMLGSIERPLGLLAAAIGDRGTAAGHFDAAIAANRVLGSPPLVALTLTQAGTALGNPDHLARARELYDELGWSRCVTRLDRMGARNQTHGAPTPPTDAGRMVRVGDRWELAFRGTTVHVNDSKGLHDIATLLGRPNVEVPALELASASVGATEHPHSRRSQLDATDGEEGNLGPPLDERARDAYRTRLAELEGEIDEARSNADVGRLERLESEHDLLVSELASAYGLGGTPRRPGDRAERARTTVTSRIRYSIDRLEKVHPELGRHLRNTVTTGRYCCYRPERAVSWEL